MRPVFLPEVLILTFHEGSGAAPSFHSNFTALKQLQMNRAFQ